MRKYIISILSLLIVIYITSLVYIGKEAPNAFESYISNINRYNPYFLMRVSEYNSSLFGAKSVVEANIIDSKLLNQTKEYLKEPLKIKMDISYLPIAIDDGFKLGAIEAKSKIVVSNWIKESSLREYKNIFPDDIINNYSSIIGFDNIANEKSLILPFRVVSNDEILKVSKVIIDRKYNINTFEGLHKLNISSIKLLDNKSDEKMRIDNLKYKLHIKAIDKSGLIYANSNINIDNIKLNLDNNILHLFAKASFSLSKENQNFSKIALNYQLKAKDKNSTILYGIKEINNTITISHLGTKGLRELLELEKEQLKNRVKLQKAINSGDSLAMTNALSQIAKSEDKLVRVANDTLISAKSNIKIYQRIKDNKDSYLKLDAIYMGKPLQSKNIVNAMFEIIGEIDRLFNGNLDMKMSRELIGKLYPNATFILDSMVDKGLAKFENGLYILKASMQDGKIIINNTKYNPQELIMMILM